MDRRNFLRMMVGGVAAAAAVRTFPFRVFSFPQEILLAPEIAFRTFQYSSKPILVSIELLQDSYFSIESLLADEYGRRLALAPGSCHSRSALVML